MDQFPIGYQLSVCPPVSMIKLLKRRIIRYIMSWFFFFFFFVTFFVCFQESFNTTKLFVCNISSKRTLKHRPKYIYRCKDKEKINIVQLMDQFPIGYQLSACPLVPMIKRLKRRIIRYMMSCFLLFFFVCLFVFFFFLSLFCKRDFCVFSREFQQTVSSRYSVCRWIFF